MHPDTVTPRYDYFLARRPGMRPLASLKVDILSLSRRPPRRTPGAGSAATDVVPLKFKITRQQWIAAAWVAGWAVAAMLVALVTAIAVVGAQLPELDEITHYQPRQPLEILSRDGLELAQFGPERRRFVPINDFPKILRDALLATEDADFYSHSGVSVKGIARAFLSNLFSQHRQGASTITQQVARNFFLSRRQSYSRKFSEALLAMKIERALTKDQILELYMNQIYLGQHAYGFEAAAWTYFGKPSSQLNAAEAAMLAGLPKNPRFADPVEHFDRAKARQLLVLERMRETGVLNAQQVAQAKATPLHVTGRWEPAVHAEYLAEMVRQTVVQRFGEAAYSQGLKVTTSIVGADQDAAWAAVRRGILDFDRRQPYRGPEDNEDLPDTDTDIDQAAALALREHADDDDLRVAVVTHASPKEIVAILATGDTVRLTGEALRGVQPALRANAPESLAITRGSIIRLAKVEAEAAPAPKAGARPAPPPAQWRVTQWPDVESCLVALDTQTGRLRALVGGFDFSRNQFNHVTSAWRQPGSSFKPFIYSAALEHAVQPATLINDAPLEFQVNGKTWAPKNDDNEYDGPITLRTALAKSKNLVSIRLVQMMGVANVRDWAARFGLLPGKQPENLTLALGAGSVTPMQMVRAYAAFGNGGYGITPRFIEKITDAQGKVLFEAPALPDEPTEDQRILPVRNAFVMASLLNEVARTGTGFMAQKTLKRSDIYGKTGTTNDAVDAWFAGFNPKIAAVVWMGHDDNRSLGAREFGATAALPVWIDYMRQALKDQPVVALKTPEGVQDVNGEWFYDEYVDGGYIAQIGMQPGSGPPAIVMAPRPGEGASAAGMPEGAVALPPMQQAPPPPNPAPAAAAAPAARPSAPANTNTIDPLERLPPQLR
jgi:penicillin-binding protein 1A